MVMRLNGPVRTLERRWLLTRTRSAVFGGSGGADVAENFGSWLSLEFRQFVSNLLDSWSVKVTPRGMPSISFTSGAKCSPKFDEQQTHPFTFLLPSSCKVQPFKYLLVATSLRTTGPCGVSSNSKNSPCGTIEIILPRTSG